MRRQFSITCFLICSFTGQNLLAQIGDWSEVAAEPPGTPIYVIAKRHHRACELLRVTNNELLCEEGPTPLGSRTLVLPRREIQEVREVHAREAKTAIGTVLGAAAGIGIGLATIKTKDAETQVYGTIGCALAGGIVGAVIGRISGEHHSKIIYKR